ncbi:MAG: phage regulatory CII family protein [Kiloniellales bacterium]
MTQESRIENSLVRDLGSLEEAVAVLLGQFTKLLDAAAHCRVGPKQLSAYANPDTQDRHMPVDVVLDLEGAARDPIVTRCLAAQQSFVLFRLPAVRACRLWDRHHRRVVKGGSIVFAKLTEVLEDGRISKQEAADLLAEVDQALSAFAGLRSSLQKRLERSDPGERAAE